jgi:hypothetical protein
MKLITLKSGIVIDLDSVVFVWHADVGMRVATYAIAIGLAGHEKLLSGDDARQFLTELQSSKQVNVENLLKRLPVKKK